MASDTSYLFDSNRSTCVFKRQPACDEKLTMSILIKSQIMNYGIGGKISLHLDTLDEVGWENTYSQLCSFSPKASWLGNQRRKVHYSDALPLFCWGWSTLQYLCCRNTNTKQNLFEIQMFFLGGRADNLSQAWNIGEARGRKSLVLASQVRK